MMEEAEVTERFTRVSKDEILYQFEVNDKKAYRDVWKGEMPLRSQKVEYMNMLVMKEIMQWQIF